MKNNAVNVRGNFTIIKVWSYKTKELLECWVDTDVVAELPDVTWYATPARSPNGKFYVCGKLWDAAAKRSRTIMLHRAILGITDPSIEVDHRDNNGLNNRRKNLRTCTHKENLRYRDPGYDWKARDARAALNSECRTERQIASGIARQFGISRCAMYKIRMGVSWKNGKSPIFDAYWEALRAAKVRSLFQLHQLPELNIHGVFGVFERNKPTTSVVSNAQSVTL